MTPPCYGCAERAVGCHAGCKRYAAWKDTKENERRERAKLTEDRFWAIAAKDKAKRREWSTRRK